MVSFSAKEEQRSGASLTFLRTKSTNSLAQCKHLSSSPSAEQILTDMTKQRHKCRGHKKAKGTALQIGGSQMKKQLNNES
jgi:hypothetical protein